MARREIVQLTDDLDQSEATQTIAFALDGTSYEIDLNDKHADELRDRLAVYTGVSRRVGGRRATTRAVRSSAPGPQVVREWAESQGLTVSPRGRISKDVQEKYDAAH
jgi:hypothetical protein